MQVETIKGKSYHAAVCRGKNSETAVLQLRESIDLLSCEALKYLGQYSVTKANCRKIAAQILDAINATCQTAFKRLAID